MIFSMSVPKTRKYEQHYWLHTTVQDSSKCPKCFAFSLFKLNVHLNDCIKTKQITENIKKKLSNFLTLCSDSYYTLRTQKALVHADDNFSKNTCCFSLACLSPDSCNHWECVSQPRGKKRTLVITISSHSAVGSLIVFFSLIDTTAVARMLLLIQLKIILNFRVKNTQQSRFCVFLKQLKYHPCVFLVTVNSATLCWLLTHGNTGL